LSAGFKSAGEIESPPDSPIPKSASDSAVRLFAVEQFFDGQNLNFRIITMPEFRAIKARARRFGYHVARRYQIIAIVIGLHSNPLLPKDCSALRSADIIVTMRVFLSHASSPFDIAFASRLRAVALGYDVELLLPDALHRQFVIPATKNKIKDSAAVIALITAQSTQTEAVNLELQEAQKQKKPIIAFVEDQKLIQGLPAEQIVVFHRSFKELSENQLFNVVRNIASKRNQEELGQTLAALGLGVLALLAFGELIKEK